MDKKQFINSIKEGALKGKAQYGILPSLTIAQAILESGWGSSQLTQMGNNLFGIKAFSDWTGRRITLPTTEWYRDEMKVISSDFRAYDSLNDSIADHSRLLSNNRYKLLRECKDYKKACQKVYECGYATDPQYPEKLISIIEGNKLYEFDAEAEGIDMKADTKSANKIRRFQCLCNELGIKDSEGKVLVEDNILGWRTKSCIAKLPILKLCSAGQAVEFVQQIVDALPVDGEFWPITRQRVIEYQRNNSLEADGIVGVQTWTNIVTT